jgi:YVTN family beta-propeller protein
MSIVGNCLPLLVCGTLFGVAVSGQTPAPEEKKPTSPPLQLEFSRVTPDAVVYLSGPHVMAAADDAVWVLNRAAGTAVRVEGKSGKVVQVIAVGKEPCAGAVSGFGSLWVALCGAPGLARVDLKTGAVTATIKTGVLGEPRTIANAASSIWLVTDGRGTLTRFDPAANAAVAEMYVAPGTNRMVFGQGALWTTSPVANQVGRINPATNLLVETIKAGKAPASVAVGEGAVWALNQGDGTVSRIDTKTNKVAETIKIGAVAAGGEIAAGEGSVWVSAPGTPLIRIDPRTNAVAQHFTGAGGGALIVGQGSVWVVAGANEIWRLDPKRVEATR